MSLKTTSSQTIGPYLRIGLTWLITENLVAPGVQGTPVTIEGRVTDGEHLVDDGAGLAVVRRRCENEDIGQAKAITDVDEADVGRELVLCCPGSAVSPVESLWGWRHNQFLKD